MNEGRMTPAERKQFRAGTLTGSFATAGFAIMLMIDSDPKVLLVLLLPVVTAFIQLFMWLGRREVEHDQQDSRHRHPAGD